MAITRKKPLSCPIEVTISIVSARWKARIIWQLAESRKTFTPLKGAVGAVSDRMLNEQLTQLIDDKVVDYEQAGQTKRYGLTALGHALLPVLRSMHDWGEKAVHHRLREEAGDRRAAPHLASAGG
ncbi:MAG: helix-turn-helix transcriptional regulator [Chitinophagaceae bacterium]|nr:helix-turn-helix transcriptional regulator [Rubrivivax sp.]